jgi:D-aspartate ligase
MGAAISTTTDASLPPAVVLGGENAGVSTARSLARLGVEVYALADTHDPQRWSRAVSTFVDVGSKHGVEARYMEWLAQGPRGAVIVPCYDDGQDTVARNRAQLESWGYRTLEGDDEVNRAMLDKTRSLELCRRAGVPAPGALAVRTAGDARRAAAELPLPLALKPIESHLFAREFGETKLLVADDAAELERLLGRTLELGIDMLATELIPGWDDQIVTYYTYLDERGRPLYHFTKRKLRQWPIHFGLACYQLTTWDPKLAEVGLRFCQGVGLRGICTVEFKHDARDGEFKFIECNPRLTGSNELVRHAGIEIPQIAYLRALGRRPEPVRGYRTGVHEWYAPEDLKALAAYRGAGELTTAAWLRSLLRRQRFPMLSARDPLPTLATSALRALNVVRRRAGRLLGR